MSAELARLRVENRMLRSRLEIIFWNQWLHTADGSGYQAGWGDDASREQAARGKAWVAKHMDEFDVVIAIEQARAATREVAKAERAGERIDGDTMGFRMKGDT